MTSYGLRQLKEKNLDISINSPSDRSTFSSVLQRTVAEEVLQYVMTHEALLLGFDIHKEQNSQINTTSNRSDRREPVWDHLWDILFLLG